MVSQILRGPYPVSRTSQPCQMAPLTKWPLLTHDSSVSLRARPSPPRESTPLTPLEGSTWLFRRELVWVTLSYSAHRRCLRGGGWFFVVCNGPSMVQQGPGGAPADCLFTLHPYSEAGCADLPLALLCAPSQHRGDPGHGLSASPRPRTRGPPSRHGTERSHVVVRHTRGSDTIHSDRSPWGIQVARIRLDCTGDVAIKTMTI
jgi:hypothetical protein